MAQSEKITLDDLRQKATNFATKTWNSRRTHGWSMGQLGRMEFNPGLQNGCPALQNYCEGYRRLDDFVDAKSNTFFAWHGTPNLSNIASICYHGFSPAKRKRQHCGPGEYFGVVAEDSHNYSGNTDRLIVAQIIRCKHVRTLQNCHVVDNPKTHKYTFTLPVLVIAYGNSAQLPIPWIQAPTLSIPSPFLASQPAASRHQHANATSTVWQWTKDDGSLEPFNPNINTVLEQYYQHYLKGGSHTFTVGPITRYCDKATQQYIIDFRSMTQENQSTRFKRGIQRSSQTIPQASSVAFWQWTKDDGSLEPFNANNSTVLEQYYQHYLKGGSHTLTVGPITRYCDKATQQYIIDFTSMTQENQSTRFKRGIQRSSQMIPQPIRAARHTSTGKTNNSKGLLVKPRASLWKWHWMKDGGSPEPYPDSVSNLIEHHYQLHISGGPRTLHIPGITRICDNAIQSYTIDFGPPMTQSNQTTGYQRQLTRVLPVQHTITSLLPSLAAQPKASTWQWYWLMDDNTPEPYSKSVSNRIERHYQWHASGGPQSFKLSGITRQCDNLVQSYTISFRTPMAQINQNTLFVRQIQRALATQSSIVNQQSNIQCQQVKPKASPFKWHWTTDDGGLELYPDPISELIEHHYQLYGKGGPQSFETPALTRECDGFPQTYIIDFSMPFSQTNRKSGFTRQVSRIMPAQPRKVLPSRQSLVTYQGSSVTTDKSINTMSRRKVANFKESGYASIQETKQQEAHSGAHNAISLPETENETVKSADKYNNSTNNTATDKSFSTMSRRKVANFKESGYASILETKQQEAHSGAYNATSLPETENETVKSADKYNNSTNNTANNCGDSNETLPLETTSPTNSEALDIPSIQAATSPSANAGESETTLQEENTSSDIAKTWFSPVFELVAGLKTLFWGNPSEDIAFGKDCLNEDALLY